MCPFSWYMGADALEGNGITRKIVYFFRDKALTPMDEPLRKVRKSRILLFVAVQLLGFGATMAVTQTIGTSLLIMDSSESVHILLQPLSASPSLSCC